MLHPENRESGKKGHRALKAFLSLLFPILLLASCILGDGGKRSQLSIEDFSDLQAEEYALSAQQLREHLEHILHNDHDSTMADRRVRQYYRDGGSLMWINRNGVNVQADTLIDYLNGRLSDMGFSEQAFALPELAARLSGIRRLCTDSQLPLSEALAELEYGLTKTFARYMIGQRFGFANPYALYNRLDVREVDEQGNPKVYNRLFDIDVEQPSPHYLNTLQRLVLADSVGESLRAAEPTDGVYHQLKAALQNTTGKEARQRLLVNMERRRWHTAMQPDQRQKHVFVNVAAQQLWAVSPDSILNMRVVCGARKTKTPLLHSAVNLIQVNPEWIIPMSILKNETSRHAGDSAYFARNHYYITRRGTGEQVDVKSVSAADMASGAYRVAQEGGAGNSLGRIVFRFPNQFSVYLHDTSNPGAFNNASRALSHGCVRVQRPFDLARFMIDDSDEWLLDRLRISMDMKPETDRGREYLEQHTDEHGHHRLVTAIGVKPQIPVFIDYYTVYPDPVTKQFVTWPDPYGYDQHILRAIKPFLPELVKKKEP